MRHQRLFIALLFAAGTATAADLQVVLDPIQPTGGTLLVSVHREAASWDGRAAAVTGARKTVEPEIVADDGRVQLAFSDLEPGSYAVLVLHDRNDNGDLDANAFGMPTEPYGFSNNPRVMRKATFDEARFDVPPEGATITVQMR